MPPRTDLHLSRRVIEQMSFRARVPTDFSNSLDADAAAAIEKHFFSALLYTRSVRFPLSASVSSCRRCVFKEPYVRMYSVLYATEEKRGAQKGRGRGRGRMGGGE